MIVAAAVFGAIIGSFCNVLLLRMGTGRSALKGRSRCMHCGHTLRALDLVPILSYLFLRGRCRYCHAKVSPQYPLVEATAALLSAAVYVQYPDPYFYAFWFVVWLTLLFVVVYDLRHMIVPLQAALLLGALAFGYAYLFGTDGQLVAGVMLAAPLFFISFLSRGAWMGWGDWQVEISLGWLLGLTMGLTALMLAFWIGAVVGIGLILFKKGLPAQGRVTMKSEVPFVPFLVAGAALCFFFNVDYFETLPLLFL